MSIAPYQFEPVKKVTHVGNDEDEWEDIEDDEHREENDEQMESMLDTLKRVALKEDNCKVIGNCRR